MNEWPQPPPPSDSSVVDELKESLQAADRSIELARRERERLVALSSSNAAGLEAERRVLEQARGRREQLAALKPPVAASPAPAPQPDPPQPAGLADLPVPEVAEALTA